ncbi:oligoendopeptidase F, partial [Brevibacillus sp. NRRL NRS-603]
MNMRWNLGVLYSSFDAPEWKQDWEKLVRETEEIKSWAAQNLQSSEDAVAKMEKYITMMTSVLQTQFRLYAYGELTASVDAKNEAALLAIEKVQNQAVELVEPGVQFQKWLGSLSNLNDLISQSELLETHRFMLTEMSDKSKYMLSEKEEIVLAKMKNTGS